MRTLLAIQPDCRCTYMYLDYLENIQGWGDEHSEGFYPGLHAMLLKMSFFQVGSEK